MERRGLSGHRERWRWRLWSGEERGERAPGEVEMAPAEWRGEG